MRSGEHPGGTVDRPISLTSVQFHRRTPLPPAPGPNDPTEPERVSVRPAQPDAQPRRGESVSKKFRLIIVLRDGQVHAAILIEISNRTTALFAVNFYAAF